MTMRVGLIMLWTVLKANLPDGLRPGDVLVSVDDMAVERLTVKNPRAGTVTRPYIALANPSGAETDWQLGWESVERRIVVDRRIGEQPCKVCGRPIEEVGTIDVAGKPYLLYDHVSFDDDPDHEARPK